MIVADWLFNEIIKLNIRHLFLVPGMEIDPFCARLEYFKEIMPIVACHEEGAGFMADGFARVSNQIGLCMVIGAPGAANTIPSVMNANADCSKVLFITGGSPLEEAGRNTFQNSAKSGTKDAEIINLASRYSQQCDVPMLVPLVWRNCIKAILSNVPGPAHLTILQDLQNQEIPSADVDHDYSFQMIPTDLININQLQTLIEKYLTNNTKILFNIGRGAKISGAKKELLAFIEKYHIPFSLSMGGKGFLPETHPLYVGLLGYAGLGRYSFACHQRAYELLLSNEIEVIVNIGHSMSFFSALHRDKKIVPTAKMVQIDLSLDALGRDFNTDLEIQSDINAAFSYLNQLDIPQLKHSISERQLWMKNIVKTPMFYRPERLLQKDESMDPAYVVAELNKAMPDNTILFIDTGIHSPISGHYWLSREGGDVIYASNLGPMGFAIPAAIGGKLAAPHQPVVAIVGDGCMRMHGIEIMTAAHYKIPIILVVSNNAALGKVYMRSKNTNETSKNLTLLPQGDWVGFAKSLGADGFKVEHPKDLQKAFEFALASKGPFVIDVMTKRDVPPII